MTTAESFRTKPRSWCPFLKHQLERTLEKEVSGLSVADRYRIIEGDDPIIPIDDSRQLKIVVLWFFYEWLFLSFPEAKKLHEQRRMFLDEGFAP